jgi:nucleotide sugar dehydrogenase
MIDVAIVGLGYVGLPLALAANDAGLSVVGIDISRDIVDRVNSGSSHVDDVSDLALHEALAKGFAASTEWGHIDAAEVVVICVPTPLAPEGGPDLRAVEAAAKAIAERQRPQQLVILESTTWPGTTDQILLPLFAVDGREVGKDFFLAFSPERVDPGNRSFGIRNTPKVVGGVENLSGQRAAAFYSRFVDKVVMAKGSREAEMSKLLENTYRQINIALVNEMAKFSHDMQIDFWDVIRCASTKPFGFQPFLPGPGVGGHCIPIDPSYLSHRVQVALGYPFRFVELAQEINQSMPAYVASRVQSGLNLNRKPVMGARVLLLGVTYKANIGDERESPAIPVANALHKMGAHLAYHDPYVDNWSPGGVSVQRLTELDDKLEDWDFVVLLQWHDEYR